MVSLLHLLPNVKMHRRYRSLPPSPNQEHQDSNNFDDQKTYIHMVRKVSYGRVWKDVVLNMTSCYRAGAKEYLC